MTDTPQLRTVTLDTPIQRGEQTIETVQIRKPRAGELRGLALVDLGQLKVDALGVLLPRITLPPLSPAEVANMDPADLSPAGPRSAVFCCRKRGARMPSHSRRCHGRRGGRLPLAARRHGGDGPVRPDGLA
jgi:hypothetical protein